MFNFNQQFLERLQSEFKQTKVPAQENQAVALCCRAALLGEADARNDGSSAAQRKTNAANGFRLALPALRGRRNVRDFIACVTHGMLLGYIKPREGTRLLYAAQVAYTTRRPRKKRVQGHKEAPLPQVKATKSSPIHVVNPIGSKA